MKFTLFSFSTCKSKPKTREQLNKEYWLNEFQLLFPADAHDEVILVRGRDIECCWTEGNGQPYWKTFDDGHIEANPKYKTSYFIRTKSGQTFKLQTKSWMKCRFEDPEYEDPNHPDDTGSAYPA